MTKKDQKVEKEKKASKNAANSKKTKEEKGVKQVKDKVDNTKQEQQTKEIKKSKKVSEVSDKKSDIKKLIILISIIIVVFLIFYLVTLYLNKNNHDDIFKKEDLGNTEIQYEEIIVGTILSQSPNTYYVLVEDEKDVESAKYTNKLTEYKSYTYKHKIYTVDLTSVLNKNSVADESSFDSDKLKFKKTTLLKVEDKKIVDVYEDDDQISEQLDNLLNEAKENTES